MESENCVIKRDERGEYRNIGDAGNSYEIVKRDYVEIASFIDHDGFKLSQLGKSHQVQKLCEEFRNVI